MDLPSLRNKSIKSQDDVLDLLKQIQYAASDDKLAGVCFQLRALLPECTGSESLVELSSLLMHSPEYYQIAVSLIRYIVQDICKDGQCKALQEYVNSRKKYETDKRLPSLQLRELLWTTAGSMKEKDEIEPFIHHFANLSLKANPDRFNASSDYCRMLKLFEKLLMDGKIKRDGSDLKELQEVLLKRGRKDLVRNQLENFSPHRPYTLAVMNVGK